MKTVLSNHDEIDSHFNSVKSEQHGIKGSLMTVDEEITNATHNKV